MEAKGYKVRDERTRPAGQKEWSGPHLHVSAPERGQKTYSLGVRDIDTPDFGGRGIRTSDTHDLRRDSSRGLPNLPHTLP
jgi:hypothetical protein